MCVERLPGCPPAPKKVGPPDGLPITTPRIKLRDGRHLSYKEYGVPKESAKYKIIFVHGYDSVKHYNVIASTTSPALIEELGIYIVSFDRPGYGESDPDPKRTLKSFALDTEELADQLGLGSKFYVVGFSMGGQAVWSFLKYIPHRLAGATLIAPFVKAHGDTVMWNVYEESILKRFGAVNEDPMAELKNLRNVNYPNKATTVTTPVPNTQVVTKYPALPSPAPRKQSSQKEFAEKRAKNLCFYCDQKYVRGHKCGGQMYALEIIPLEEDNDLSLEETLNEVDNENHGESELLMSECYPQISLNALSGVPTYNTIRMKASDLVMKFVYEGRKICLRGTKQSELQWMSGKHLSKQVVDRGDPYLASINCLWPTTSLNLMQASPDPNTPYDPELRDFLLEYGDVFAVPTELPPQRSYDHWTPLKDASTLINIRPYKYPPNQKYVIEQMVNELLDTRVIRMCEKDIYKTAFKSHDGHYEFVVIPFNAPSTFQALMNSIKPFLRKFTLVFFDDILVYSPSKASHLYHLRQVLQVMREHTLYAKESKYVFGTDSVEYLGHIISVEGVATDSKKIEAMQAWPVPTNLKQLRGFWGLTGYYRRHFKIKTDHFSLKYVLDQRITTPFQSKWFPKLLGFDYEIEYKKGKENVVADALSSVQRQGELFSLLSEVITNEFMDVVTKLWTTDPVPSKVIQGLEGGTAGNSKYTWHNQQLRRKGKWVGMRRMVKELVDACQRNKADLSSYPALFKKLLLVFFVGILSLAYQSTRPPPPKKVGPPDGLPITSPRIKLRDGRHLSYKEYGVPKDSSKNKIVFVHGFDSVKHHAVIATSGSPV
nr:putative alpha/beta hydrolase fold protein [Tanacetum cinerariifolium]